VCLLQHLILSCAVHLLSYSADMTVAAARSTKVSQGNMLGGQIITNSLIDCNYVIIGAILLTDQLDTMVYPADDPALQLQLQALERYKNSLVDPYSQAAQDVSAAQVHLETLARHKFLLNKNIDSLPSYRDPPDHGETPCQRSRRIFGWSRCPK